MKVESESWETISYSEGSIDCMLRPEEGQYQIGNRYGKDSDGYVFLLTDRKVTHELRIKNPRSTDRSPYGRAVIADWREFGVSTGSEVLVLESDGSTIFSEEFDGSSPFVAISDDGQYIAVCPFDGKTRIIEVDTGRLVTLHENVLDERQKPRFVGDEPELYLGQNASETAAYSISLSGEIRWQSDGFSKDHFIEAIELTADSDWPDVIDEFITLYKEGDNSRRRRINDTLVEGSLATITNVNRLEKIIDALEEYYAITEGDDDRRAVSIRLADAYYRVAKQLKREGGNSEFYENLQIAIDYAQEGLPWYGAKKHLAKAYRLKSRVHKQRNEYEAAYEAIEGIFELEEEYGVQLSTEADEKLREQLSN